MIRLPGCSFGELGVGMWFGTVHLRQTQFRPLHKKGPSPRNREVEVHLEPTPSFWQPNQGSGRRKGEGRGWHTCGLTRAQGTGPVPIPSPPEERQQNAEEAHRARGAPRGALPEKTGTCRRLTELRKKLDSLRKSASTTRSDIQPGRFK